MKTRHSPCLLLAAGALFALSACGEEDNDAACTEHWQCASLEVCIEGECVWSACTPESNPLCDVDGEWFPDECAARINGVDFELDPVCGENGLDYGNACGAIGDGTTVAYEGECRPEDQRLSDPTAR